MTDPALAWRVEETCLNAWPALREVLLDGWLLRFSEGLTRRANSANSLRPVADAPQRDCEALYRRQALPTIFRVLSLIDLSVDQRLAAAGYTREGESCVLYGQIDHIAAAKELDVRVLSQATPGWFTAMAALQNHTDAEARTYRGIVGQLAIPAGFAMLVDNRDVVALAYGALHNGLLCYESVITDGRRRKSGFGRRVITTLAAWAKENGAVAACLEVEAGNTAARALYQAIGLDTELYHYHYRRGPRPTEA